MLMSWDYVHEVGQLDPEDMFEGEEFGAGLFIKIEDLSWAEPIKGNVLGHWIAELSPEGTAMVDGSWQSSPSGVCNVSAYANSTRNHDGVLTLRELQILDRQNRRCLDVCNPQLLCQLGYRIWIKF